MPISVAEHPLNPEQSAHFSKVLREDQGFQQQLELALQQQQGRLFAAHFNGQPVAVALLDTQGQRLQWLVVHPATRKRGVGKDFLAQINRQLGQPLTLPESCAASRP